MIARDLTGSGKTLAFCLPITEYLRKNNFLGQRKIQAIMLCPTRELAIQVSVLLKQMNNLELRSFIIPSVYLIEVISDLGAK